MVHDTKETTAPATLLMGEPPLAWRQVTIDEYHGVRVADPYRWMETATKRRDDWFKAQNDYARRVIGVLPGRDLLRDQLREANRTVERVDLLKIVGVRPRIFALRRGASDETYKLVTRVGWKGPEGVLVDPARREDGRSKVAIDFASPSPDGRYVAYGVTLSDSDDVTLEIVEVQSGRVLPDRISRIAGLTVSWRPDGRSFFYTRRSQPAAGGQPSERGGEISSYLHKIGDDPDLALPVFGPSMRQLGLEPHNSNWVEAFPRSQWALATVQVGVVDRAFFVSPLRGVTPGKTRWRRVATADDEVASMLVYRDRVLAFTYANAPNYRIVAFDAQSESVAVATDFFAASDLVLVDFAAARDAMYVVALDTGAHRLFRMRWSGAAPEEVKLPFRGSVGVLLADPERAGVVLRMEGWIQQPAWFEFAPARGMRELAVVLPGAEVGGLVAEQTTSISRDGTEVPLSIVRRRDRAIDGTAPALLGGYGAYGVPANPTYNPFTIAWVKRGGVYAFCHVRGGGDRGKQWHLAGIKEKKENGVDDFIACAEHLIEGKYTSSARLTAIGTSAGGIVVGGAITKRPELFKAAILRVAQLNPLRHEVAAGGTAHDAEYGSLKVEAEFRSLLASDPYHRIRPHVKYPAVLLTAGLNDIRVPVWQAAKFAARLQASGGPSPTLLRIESDSGHGFMATQTERAEEYADAYAFALWQSGVAVRDETVTETRE